MIDLGLLHDVHTGVYVSTSPVSVSRVGEIILLPNELNSDDEKPFESREPYKSFVAVSAGDWSYSQGTFAQTYYSRASNKDDILHVKSYEWHMQQVYTYANLGEGLNLAFIQQDKNNGLHAMVSKEAALVGVRVNAVYIDLAFSLSNAEMIYNR